MNKKGFSLIEIIIYLGIISIIAITFFRILGVSTRIQVSQVAANEVANQINFVMQTIQRLVRESSAVIVSDNNGVISPDRCIDASDASNDESLLLGADQPCLKLRMKDSARDPLFIWKDEETGSIKIKEGTNQESDLTTGKVLDSNNKLVFRKYTNYPGHDTIEITLTLNYNSENQQAQVQRVAKTAISRVSAATFDSSLLSGDDGFGGTFNIGQDAKRWANAFITNLDVSGTITQPENFDNINTRGFMVIGAKATPLVSCNTICGNQSLTCFAGYNFTPITLLPPQIGMVATTCSTNLTDGGLCFCY